MFKSLIGDAMDKPVMLLLLALVPLLMVVIGALNIINTKKTRGIVWIAFGVISLVVVVVATACFSLVFG